MPTPGFLLEELGDDETLVLILSAAATIVLGFAWYVRLIRATTIGTIASSRIPLLFLPIPCLALILFVLLRWSARDVATDPRYILLFLSAGCTVLLLFDRLLPFAGLSIALDSIDARNPAATVAASGAFLAVSIVYAGGNIGEGPTIWTTLGPAVLAVASLFGLQLTMELIASPSESITVDRDLPSAVRLAGFLVASSLILGRSVAGDYHSAADTLSDFISQSWPVLPLAAAAIIVHFFTRPGRSRLRTSILLHGIVPAIVYISLASIWLARLGHW